MAEKENTPKVKGFDLKFKPAYLVKSWAPKIIHGWASTPVKEPMYSSDEVLFTANKEEYSFEPTSRKGSTRGKGVYFCILEANLAVATEKAEYKKYLEKQVKESNEKLKEIG